MKELQQVLNSSLKSFFKLWYLILPIILVSETTVLLAGQFWNQNVMNNLSQLPFSFLLGIAPTALITPFGKALIAKIIYKYEFNQQHIIYKKNILIKFIYIALFSIIWYLGTLLGCVLLVVPGLIIFFGLQLGTQAIIVEDLNFIQGIKKSFYLVKKNISMLILAFFLIEIASAVLTTILTQAFTSTTIYNQNGKIIVDAVISMISACVVYIPLAHIYFVRSSKSRL